MDIKIKRGQILKDLRKTKGLNQNDLAEFLGVSQQAYQKYEYGTAEPSFDNLIKLADLYNVTTDYLLGRDTDDIPVINKLASEFNMSAFEKKIFEGYVNYCPYCGKKLK